MHRIPRRRFVKGLFLGTAISSLLGKSWKSAYAATFTPASGVPTFTIKISDYPALQDELGSVRLGVNPVGSDDFPAGFYWPIIINKDTDGAFYVLNSECRHAGCVVNAYDTFEGGLRCRCHGSLYDVRGQVVEGPAEEPLFTHDFTLDGQDSMTIVVPQMGFTVRSFLPDREPTARLQLQIDTQWNIFYEVRFREKLNDPWTPAMFSLTPDGPATEEVLVGDGLPVTLYLDRTTATGFYAVSMRMSEV